MIALPWLLAALALPAHASDLQTVEGGDPLDEPTAQQIGLPTDGDPIINGTAATRDDYPETGGVVLSINGYGLILWCTGTLIAPDVVLLSAFCVDDTNFQEIYQDDNATIAAIGWSRQADLTLWEDGSDDQWPDDVVMANTWVEHEQFSIDSMAKGLAQNDDVALLMLASAVTDVDPAYLPTDDEAAEIAQNDSVDVVGWGYTTSDLETGTFGTKMQGTSDISRLATYEFQVGELTESVRDCYVDFGGPAFRTYPDTRSTVKQRLIGVTSHTYDTTECENTGAVDTRVDYYKGWIDGQMRSRCADGSRVWCDEPGVLDPPEPPAGSVDLLSDVHLTGCATAPGAAGFAWLGALVALAVRRRRVA